MSSEFENRKQIDDICNQFEEAWSPDMLGEIAVLVDQVGGHLVAPNATWHHSKATNPYRHNHPHAKIMFKKRRWPAELQLFEESIPAPWAGVAG